MCSCSVRRRRPYYTAILTGKAVIAMCSAASTSLCSTSSSATPTSRAGASSTCPAPATCWRGRCQRRAGGRPASWGAPWGRGWPPTTSPTSAAPAPMPPPTRSRRHSADSPGTRPPWRRPTASLCCALPPAPASPVATWMRTRAPERHPVVPSRDLLGIASFEWPRSGPFQNIPLVGLEQRWKHLELAASTGNTRETESSVCLRAFEREQQRASERGTKVFG
mmetsp:Transcript_5717/g.16346  ORF Transcript_5717/g.16346 Transcript_5717/m.16346 type:complete len:222 (+) Transcript_5717:1570-2235(+)